MKQMQIMQSRGRTLLAAVGGLIGVGVLGLAWWSLRAAPPALTSFEERNGLVFLPPDKAPLESIQARLIPLPEFPGRWAIWGSSGRDRRGHLWFAVCAHDVQPPSAHLYEYDPVTDSLTDRGNVVDELREAGILREGEGQMKIHTKIVQAEDGHLYFASMDEQGEKADGSRLPTYGSHLWRLRLPENRWEHLQSAPEGLIAVATSGRYVYSLGYFDHVLYQYDCRTGNIRKTTIGADGGHISRNCFCDDRGHVYVPRLKGKPSLVELDTELREVAETPLENYSTSPDENSHGITGFQPLADGSIVFTTDHGYLYRVRPRENQPSELKALGWIHPNGKSYVASMFTSDGKQHLMGVGEQKDGMYWYVYDLDTQIGTVTQLPPLEINGARVGKMLLYGSVTRDNDGRCYLVGVAHHQGKDHPLLIQVSRPK
jgi:hypothetical protein